METKDHGWPNRRNLTGGWFDAYGIRVDRGAMVRRYGTAQDCAPGQVVALLERGRVVVAWVYGATTSIPAAGVVTRATSGGSR